MHIITVALLSFGITFFMIPALIPFLKRLKFGQSIRKEGPENHQKKTGTPVMGGIVFITVPVILYLIFGWEFVSDWKVLVVLVAFVGYGIIGLIDDLLVIVYKSNDGLKPRHKFLLQSLLAIFLISIAWARLSTEIFIPFTNIQIDLGIMYPIFAFLMFTATSNGVNLSDGLDGLCAGLCSIALFGFFLICYRIGYYEIAMLIGGVIASLLAYLYYNKAPAKIFMGDVGSLALGGLIAAIGLVTHHELMVAILGGVFVIEVLSVVLQVGSFKLRKGKRIFKMAPIHHHFELSGMSEGSVVYAFWFAGMIFLVLGLVWEFFI